MEHSMKGRPSVRSDGGLARFLENNSNKVEGSIGSIVSASNKSLDTSSGAGQLNKGTDQSLNELLSLLGGKRASDSSKNENGEVKSVVVNKEMIRQIRDVVVPAYRSFVPSTLLDMIKQKTDITPMCTSKDSVIMLADVSGFTKFSEKLCSTGKQGVEELSRMMNSYFDELISLIDSYGGDIVNFAGDALLITWKACDAPISTQALLACQCGLAMTPVTRYGLSLHIGIATGKMTYVVVGGVEHKFSFLMVGEPMQRMGFAEGLASAQEVVICPVTAALLQDKVEMNPLIPNEDEEAKSSSENETPANLDWGELIDLPSDDEDEAIIPIKKATSFREPSTTFEGGNSLEHQLSNPDRNNSYRADGKTFVEHSSKIELKMNNISKAEQLLGEKETDTSTAGIYYKVESVIEPATLPGSRPELELDWDHELVEAVHHMYHFIPTAASSAVLSSGSQYLNELRRVTTVFLMLDGFKVDLNSTYTSSDDILVALQEPMKGMQQILKRYQGMLRQFIIDDKGCVLIGCFGLRGFKHSDDPARAVRCSLAMGELTDRRSLQSFIGITTGDAFCGAVGSSQRREYAMIGKNVNLAARLMVLARNTANDSMSTTHTRVLCDSNTFKQAEQIQTVDFQSFGDHALKGVSTPVSVFEARLRQLHMINEQTTRSCSSRLRNSFDLLSNGGIAGRRLELLAIEKAVTKFDGQVCLIEGEEGTGKHTLMRQATLMIRRNPRNAHIVNCRANRLDQPTPFFVVLQLLGTFVGHLEYQFLVARDGNSSNRTKTSDSRYREHPLTLDTQSGDRTGIENLMATESNNRSRRSEQFKGAPLESRMAFYTEFLQGFMEFERTNSTISESSVGDINQNRFRRNGRLQRSSTKKGLNADIDPSVCHVALLFQVLRTCMNLPFRVDEILSEVNGSGDSGSNKVEQLQTPNLGVDFTQDLRTKRVITQCLNYLMTRLLNTCDARVAILISDAQFIDSPSQALVIEFVERFRGQTMLLLTSTPGMLKPFKRKFMSADSGLFELITLHPLSRDEVRHLISIVQQVEIETLGDELLEFVMEHGQGNPYKSKAIAEGLANSDITMHAVVAGEASVKTGGSRQSAPAKLLQSPLYPSANVLEATIIARFDRLPTPEQVVLKTAAVIGSLFSVHMISYILPREVVCNNSLMEILQRLESQDWVIRYEADVPQVNYNFSHELLRTVLYDLNLPSQQRLAHLGVCDYLETHHQSDLRPFLHILMHHMSLASCDIQALHYGIQAVQFCVEGGYFREALQHVNDLLKLKVGSEQLAILASCVSDYVNDLVMPTALPFRAKMSKKASSTFNLIHDALPQAGNGSQSEVGDFMVRGSKLRDEEDILMFIIEHVESEVRSRSQVESDELLKEPVASTNDVVVVKSGSNCTCTLQ